MTLTAAPSLPPLRATRAPALPVARLVAGKRSDEVAALVPRLFSLCRAAQAAAVDTALGRPVDAKGIGREILRDHLLKLCVTWPNLLGLGARPVPFGPAAGPSGVGQGAMPDQQKTLTQPVLPVGWAEGSGVAEAMFGPGRTAPVTPTDFTAFMNSSHGAAPVLTRIAQCFAPHEACADGLPPFTARTIWRTAPVENSTALRHMDHPVMRAVEARHGRGPLWRAVARLYDIEAVLTGCLPQIEAPKDGEAMVPATRGVYVVRIETDGDIVTRLDRMTPTDSLLARGGILDRSLATLPATKTGLAPLMMDILDPCSPVRLEKTDA